LKAYIPFPLNV